MRHLARALLAGVTFDAAYTVAYWLVGGRAERRQGPHPVRAYLLIIGLLSVETAVAARLIDYLRGKR